MALFLLAFLLDVAYQFVEKQSTLFYVKFKKN